MDMSVVNDLIVREYFETLGYLVSQPRKYAAPHGRHKTAIEEVDLVVMNPLVKEHKLPENFVLVTQDLKTVARAIVAVRGWHTERFYVSTLERMPDLLRFVGTESIRYASKVLGDTSMAKILCLPRLPASGELKQKTIQAMRDRGVDGIISFQTILAELVERVDANRSYDKSDVLQVIRLLKNYEFIKDRQLDMFTRQKRRRVSVARSSKAVLPDKATQDQPATVEAKGEPNTD
jgi:hypothetical protein